MERTLTHITNSLGWFILLILSFMVGFNSSYRMDQFHSSIDFLLKCYYWFITWIIVQFDIFKILSLSFDFTFSELNETLFVIFSGLIVIFGTILMFETLIQSIREVKK